MASSQSADSFLQSCINPNCQATYAINDSLYLCRKCGGLLDITTVVREGVDELRERWANRRLSYDVKDRSGVWRFRELLPFLENSPVVSLEEGNTPLYGARRAAAYCGLDHVYLKHQGANPTGSFKDTGMTTAVTQALQLGKRLVICASTGNTAASLAAYAARADLICAILVPTGQVSHAKLAQALDYGARVLEIEGNFDTCMHVIREASEDDAIYLVNSINPFRIEGQKTVAAELAEQRDWKSPDHLVVPGGNLGNSSAFGKGFRELHAAGLVEKMPRITVVQAQGASPFAKLFRERHKTPSATGEIQLIDEANPRTLASAIKIGAPVSWQKAWRAVDETAGSVITVTEQEIADAKAVIGREGIGCEPASATTVAGIKKLVAEKIIKPGEEVVAVLTGHVLKDTDYVIRYHEDTLSAEWLSDESSGLRITGHFANAPIRVSSSPAILKELFRRILDEPSPKV